MKALGQCKPMSLHVLPMHHHVTVTVCSIYCFLYVLGLWGYTHCYRGAFPVDLRWTYPPSLPLSLLKRHSTCTMCTHSIYVIDFMKKQEVHIGKPNLHRVHMHVHRRP